LKIEQEKDEKKLSAAEEKAAKKEEKQAAKDKRKSLKPGAVAVPETESAAGQAAVPASITATEPITEPVAEPETAKEPATPVIAANEAPATIAERREVSSAPEPIRTSMEDQASLRMRENADAASPEQSTPMSPTSPGDGSKVKNWLKTKFSRRSGKAEKPSTNEKEREKNKPEKAFIGGAALTGASANNSTASLSAKPSSVRDVALAGKSKEETEPEDRGRSKRRDSEVSALSQPVGDVNEEEFQEARDNFDEDLAPPPTFVAEKSSSPAREARFTEVI
jgi:hypothetical protein